jgi:hypothetical protein
MLPPEIRFVFAVVVNAFVVDPGRREAARAWIILQREVLMRAAMGTAVLGLTIAVATPAAAFETPRDGTASSYLGTVANGPGYKVSPVVPSDGFLRTVTFDTAHGRFEVHGIELAKERIRELQALHRLTQMSESDVFTKSLGKAALAPVRLGADLVKDPGATLNRTFSGIGNMFERIGASVDNQKSSRDSTASSLLGIDKARRQLGVELGIDPYTEYPPLKQRLEDIARASALGGLSVSVALAAIPGPGGMVVSSAGTASSIKDTLREKTSAQVFRQVKATLQHLKVSAAIAARLAGNKLYSPADLLVMSSALARLKAGNTELFVARAAQANTRDVAYFQRERAELLAA